MALIVSCALIGRVKRETEGETRLLDQAQNDAEFRLGSSKIKKSGFDRSWTRDGCRTKNFETVGAVEVVIDF